MKSGLMAEDVGTRKEMSEKGNKKSCPFGTAFNLIGFNKSN